MMQIESDFDIIFIVFESRLIAEDNYFWRAKGEFSKISGSPHFHRLCSHT